MRQLFRPIPGLHGYYAPQISMGGGGTPYTPQPSAPMVDDAAQQEAARKERLAAAKALGRSNTILTDYALATATPSVLKPTLGVPMGNA